MRRSAPRRRRERRQTGARSFPAAVNIPVNPDEAAFVAYATADNAAVAPLVFKIANDGLFAWAAFAALERDNAYAFLLESAETGKNGRYSFMGAAPRRLFLFQDGVFKIVAANGEVMQEKRSRHPLRELQAQFTAAPVGEGLPPFLGGVVGYLGYDCARYFEPVGDAKKDELDVPDMLWMQTDSLFIFDHYRQELYVIKNGYREDDGGDWGAWYRRARQEAEDSLHRLQQAPRPPLRLPTAAEEGEALLPQSSHSRESFCAMVERAKEHIRAGDIFQVVPSQRFSFPQTIPALDIYRNLRRINPSPYMFHFKCDDFCVVGSSPELMLHCDRGDLLLRPIAGTKPRGGDAREDDRLERELRDDEKEIAEHLMLVDLGRNDLGRVAAIGSVAVPDDRFCRIERYSHVMHMVSDVTAVLAADKTPIDAAMATFPAGTLSGAPKVRAMQIINDLEPSKRNIYGGLAGYIGHGGDMMTCIVIRTLIAKDGKCHVQAGGGIVADSVPEKEYQESVNKAMAVLRAARATG